jgi:site-specific DNA recombinase
MSKVFYAAPSVARSLRCTFYGFYTKKMARCASIEDQLQTCRKFAEEKGWELMEEHLYTDFELSGTKPTNRIGLQALVAAAEKRPRPFDCVLLEDTSRLGRDYSDVIFFTTLMQRYGIKVCFVSQKMDSSNDTFLLLLLSTFSMIDQTYTRRPGAKVISGTEGTKHE